MAGSGICGHFINEFAPRNEAIFTEKILKMPQTWGPLSMHRLMLTTHQTIIIVSSYYSRIYNEIINNSQGIEFVAAYLINETLPWL